MKRLLLATLLCVAGLAQAQTLRWSSQGDLQTADPHSQNESMTNMVNGQVYERLTLRGKDMSIQPSLAVSSARPGLAVETMIAAASRLDRRRRRSSGETSLMTVIGPAVTPCVVAS